MENRQIHIIQLLIFDFHLALLWDIITLRASVCVWALSQGLTLASMFINDKMVPSGLLQVYNTKLKSTVNKLLKPKALGFLLQFDQSSTGQSQSRFMSLDIMRSVKSQVNLKKLKLGVHAFTFRKTENSSSNYSQRQQQ